MLPFSNKGECVWGEGCTEYCMLGDRINLFRARIKFRNQRQRFYQSAESEIYVSQYNLILISVISHKLLSLVFCDIYVFCGILLRQILF